jgi:uncharacterized protein (DUF1501 family)
MNRRKFLQWSGLASASSLMPALVKASGSLLVPGGAKKLVIIQLSGGNDGLNTFVPFEDDAYYQLRPSLAMPKDQLLRCKDGIGMHPSLAGMRGMYDEGWLSVINNVGYPEPDLSHFRSMDIWHTASGSREYWNTGWLGRWLDQQKGPVYEALEVDDALSLALKGKQRGGFAMRDVKQLERSTRSQFLQAVQQHAIQHEEETVSYLYETLRETQEAAAYLSEHWGGYQSPIVYPGTELGRDLQGIARLMTSKANIQVFYAGMTGFDTHIQQTGKQARLLSEYDEAVTAFIRDLQHHRLFDETLIFTFSEFGRRPAQNASGGTDHGTANACWLIGPSLQKPGFATEMPNLQQLTDGNLRHTIDFRSIYAELLHKWLDADATAVLGQDFHVNGLL